MVDLLNNIRLSISFFTRLPVGNINGLKEDAFEKSIWYAPISGMLIGILSSLTFLLGNYFFSPLITSLLVVVVYVVLTGALHIDGLGDFFDGVLSQKSGDDFIKVMRDSRTGTGGIVAIVLFLFMLTAILQDLIIGLNLPAMLFVIWLWPVAGRSYLLLLPLIFSYPEKIKEGTAKSFFKDRKKFGHTLFFLLLFSIAGMILFGSTGLIIAIVSGCLFLFTAYLISRKLDGLTGDMLGAILEIGQLLFLLTCYVLLIII